jgi:ribosomal protein S18 acetylase RimI-like enzyme
MTECYYANGYRQSFGFKRNPKGKIYIGKFDLFDDGDRFEIWSLGITDRYQNKGYGTQMLTEFLSQFKSDKPLYLHVYKTNEIAIRLYEKVGFTIIGECSFAPYAYTMKYNRKET